MSDRIKWIGTMLESMNNRHVVLYFLLLLFSFYFWSWIIQDNKLAIHRPVNITLKAPSGLFLSVNPDNSGSISADRENAGEWESFHAVRIDSSSFELFDPWDRDLIISPQNLIAAGSSPAKIPLFTLSVLPGNRCTISDQEGHFWYCPDEMTAISIGTQKHATQFTLTIVELYFPPSQKVLLGIGVIMILVALFFFSRTVWNPYAIVALIVAAFCFHLYAITFYDFLFPWDEQFHAVVAKSMTENPLKPMFYKHPLLPHPELYKFWVACQVWLHKQPLFMWQMALFINIFCEQPWAIRIPDLIANTTMVWIIYRIGAIIVDKRAGFLAAFLFTFSYFLFKLTTESQFTDHNDVIFLFYVTLSIWAFLEYTSKSKRKIQIVFLLLAGFFAGCAILNKWMVGLLVYSGWSIYILTDRRLRSDWRRYLDLGLSLLVCCLVFLPWQIYILNEFPVESRYEFGMNTEHFFNAVEGHSGDNLGWRYHFVNTPRTIGFSLLFILAGFISFMFIVKKMGVKLAVATWILIVFLFFTLAKSKLPAFTFVVSPLIYLCVAALLFYIKQVLDFITPQKIIARFFFLSLLIYMVSLVARFDTLLFENYYWVKNPMSGVPQRKEFAEEFRRLNEEIPKDEQQQYVIINCPLDEIGQGLFFTDVLIIYPPQNIYNVQRLKENSEFPIRYLVHNEDTIPEYIRKDSSILFLSFNGAAINESE
ncbi:glycosyltransferase family 39 protein [Bacteroidota bacterium]